VRDLHAAAPRVGEVVAQPVAGHPARRHERVLERDPAERDEELGVLRDHRPRRRLAEHRSGVPDDVRQEHERSADAVAVARRREAADLVEEPMELALAPMEEARARPPVGAAEDRRVPVRRDHAAELIGRAIERLVPRNRDEVVPPAVARRSRSALEPAAPRDGPRDPRAMADAPAQVAEKWRRVGIVQRLDRVDLAVARPHRERAPVRAMSRGRHGMEITTRSRAGA
jgi:hypothetical protein